MFYMHLRIAGILIYLIFSINANFLGFPGFRSNKDRIQTPLPPATIRTPLVPSREVPGMKTSTDDDKSSSETNDEVSGAKEASKAKIPLSKLYGDDITEPFLSENELFYEEQDKSKTTRSSSYSTAGVFTGRSTRRTPTGIPQPKRARIRRKHPIQNIIDWLPKVDFHINPVINYKFKQRINLLGACVTLGMDYLSDIPQWRAHCAVEDSIVGGRFSLRGTELGWTKAWLWNFGLMEDNIAKFKLRCGLNLKSYTAYARLRFRTEPISPFDIGDGISCAGKLPLTLLVPVLRDLPLRVEYRVRINTDEPIVQFRNDRQGKVMISTGIDRVDLSLDELNFCLEWDEKSPVWGIGIVRSDKKFMPNLSNFAKRFYGTVNS